MSGKDKYKTVPMVRTQVINVKAKMKLQAIIKGKRKEKERQTS